MQKKDQLAIDIKDLSKTYVSGEVSVPALKNIEIEIKRGEIAIIVGPSGAGKTTLLNLIGGITFRNN